MDAPTSLDTFYRQINRSPTDRTLDTGHFAVFSIPAVEAGLAAGHTMPYNRRTYYKISLIEGRNRVEYADRVIDIEGRALLFATPRVPYHYIPLGGAQGGSFCVFTDEFLAVDPRGPGIDVLPLFRPGGAPVFSLTDAQAVEVAQLFDKLRREQAGTYPYRREAIVNHLFELIHYGQKLRPLTGAPVPQTASLRLTELFKELLERHFIGLSPATPLQLRTASDYAARLAVHVNHLNTILKKATGQTTSALIRQRLLQEARVLLRHTSWTVAQVGFALGFRERSHFSAFFRQHGGRSPSAFRHER